MDERTLFFLPNTTGRCPVLLITGLSALNLTAIGHAPSLP
jgi:hypothetical protein